MPGHVVRRLRILQLAPCWFTVPPTGYGGIERVVHLLTEELVARGHDVTLAASGGSCTTARLLTHHPLPPSDRLGATGPDLEHAVAALLRAGPMDVVHDHSGLLGAALAAVAPGPAVHTVHNGWRSELVPSYRLLAGRVRLVTVSHSQAALAPSGVRVHAAVPNAVLGEDHPFRPRPARGGLAYVGRAAPEKGVLDAIAVARARGEHLEMALKVNQPDEWAYWQQVVRPALDGLDVDALLNVDSARVAAVLGEADVALVPARWDEPFGLVAAEALASGTPVVGYRRGATPEIVAEGVTGVLVDEGDHDGLAGAVDRARRLDRRRCRRDVLDRFSVGRMVDGYLRVYDDATGPDVAHDRLPALERAS